MPLLLALLAASTTIPDCRYDRTAMLALSEDAFDQDVTGGWRRLGLSGCERVAADLIRDWRAAHTNLRRRYLSLWHEGQLRAEAGQTAQAIGLFGRSFRPADEDKIGWNDYVAGSIAFLRRDRRSFDQAYARLAALPKPADFDPEGPDGKPMTIAWPMNLDVLNGFRRCWGQTYKQAYACPRAP